MKFLVVGDLHGQVPNIYFSDFDAIIAPGDFCSSDESRPLMFQAIKEQLKNPNYKKEWYDLVGKTKTKGIINRSLKAGKVILDKLNKLSNRVYVVPGNNDWFSDKKSDWDFLKFNHYNTIKSGLKGIIDVHLKIRDLGNYQIIGYGLSSSPEFPQYKADLKRFSDSELIVKKRNYDRLFSKLDSLFAKATKPVIFLSHNVPFKTSLDRIDNPDSPRNGDHFGSLVAREIILKHNPLLCIGGHMHEHFGKCRLGSTTCINAGFGSNVNTLIDLDGNRVKIKFYKGE